MQSSQAIGKCSLSVCLPSLTKDELTMNQLRLGVEAHMEESLKYICNRCLDSP